LQEVGVELATVRGAEMREFLCGCVGRIRNHEIVCGKCRSRQEIASARSANELVECGAVAVAREASNEQGLSGLQSHRIDVYQHEAVRHEIPGVGCLVGQVPREISDAAAWIQPYSGGKPRRLTRHVGSDVIGSEELATFLAALTISEREQCFIYDAHLTDTHVRQRAVKLGRADLQVCGEISTDVGTEVEHQPANCLKPVLLGG